MSKAPNQRYHQTCLIIGWIKQIQVEVWFRNETTAKACQSIALLDMMLTLAVADERQPVDCPIRLVLKQIYRIMMINITVQFTQCCAQQGCPCADRWQIVQFTS